MTIHIGPLAPEHAGELYTVQRAAYVIEAQRNQVWTLPPMLETVDEIEADIGSPDVPSLGAWLGHRLVGSVRGRPDGDRMEIVRLSVAPDLHGQGIGKRLLEAITQAKPPQVRVLWLVTGLKSEGNLRMYANAGYQQVDERLDAVGVPIAVLEKAG